MSTHILVECPEMIPSVRLGVLEPLSYLKKRGQCEVRFSRTVDVSKELLEWCDTLICVRGFEFANVKLAEIAKKSGRSLIYFLDDDLADIPPDIPSASFVRHANGAEHIQKILNLADALWVVNGRLGEKYRKWCDRVAVSRVPVKAAVASSPKTEHGPLKVLYAGSTDHSQMIREQVTPAVVRLLDKYPGRFDFTFVGADPGLRQNGIHYYGYFENYNSYKQMVRGGGFDVGLAPIQKADFYGCKYYNKFIEYAAEGIVGIYADAAPYTDIVRNHVNGLLSRPDADGWYQALLYADEHRNELLLLAENAAAELNTDFSSERVGSELETQLGDLLLRPSCEDEVKWPLLPLGLQYYLHRAGYVLKRYKMLAVAVLAFKVARHIWKRLTVGRQ